MVNPTTKYDFATTESSEWLEHYNREGFVILSNILDQASVDEMKSGCTKLIDDLGTQLLEAGKIKDLKKDAPFDKRIMTMCEGNEDCYPNLYRDELHIEETHDFLFHPNLIGCVRKILAPEVEVSGLADGGFEENGMSGEGRGAEGESNDIWSP